MGQSEGSRLGSARSSGRGKWQYKKASRCHAHMGALRARVVSLSRATLAKPRCSECWSHAKRWMTEWTQNDCCREAEPRMSFGTPISTGQRGRQLARLTPAKGQTCSGRPSATGTSGTVGGYNGRTEADAERRGREESKGWHACEFGRSR